MTRNQDLRLLTLLEEVRSLTPRQWTTLKSVICTQNLEQSTWDLPLTQLQKLFGMCSRSSMRNTSSGSSLITRRRLSFIQMDQGQDCLVWIQTLDRWPRFLDKNSVRF